MGRTEAVYRIAGCVIVRTVHHDIESVEQFSGIFFRQAAFGELDPASRIEPRQTRRSRLGLGCAQFGRRIEHLPLEIGERHRIVFDDPYRPRPAGRQVIQRGRAQSARTHDDDAALPQPTLALLSEIFDQQIAQVTFLIRFFHFKSVFDTNTAIPPHIRRKEQR